MLELGSGESSVVDQLDDPEEFCCGIGILAPGKFFVGAVLIERPKAA